MKKCSKEKKQKAQRLAQVHHKDLYKPHFCEICKFPKQVVGHHENYDKPLEVRWICHSCHKLTHNLEKTVEEMKPIIRGDY